MDDMFVELIVPHKPATTDLLKKAALIAGLVVTLFVALFMIPLALVVFMALAIFAYFIWPRFKMEYEYTYVNGEIDIAKVYSKQSRKEVAQVHLDDVECIAPLGSHELDSYGSTFKEVDYSAGSPDMKPYVIVKGGQKSEKVILQLNDKMIEDLKRRLPRKVYTY